MPDAPVKLRAASTVIVARPAQDSPFEVYMLRRSAKVDFVPDVFVFPGGGLDASDYTPATLTRTYGLSVEEVAAVFRDEPNTGAWHAQLDLTAEQRLGLYVAALRELFEEAGVLLAVDTEDKPVEISSPESHRRFAAYRIASQKGELSFVEMLSQERLRAALSRLTYFSHWITPVSEHRRYDTHFFLATASADQHAESDFLETTEGVWIAPNRALERYKARDFNLIYPTLLHLRRLAAQPSLEALQEYARTKPIVSAMPEVTWDDAGKPRFALAPETLDRW